MTAKDVRFSVDARDRMLHGIDILNNAVKVTLGPRAAMWCSTSLTARPASPRTGLPSLKRSSSKISSKIVLADDARIRLEVIRLHQ